MGGSRGAGGPPPFFVQRCRLFNIGHKVGPSPGSPPPFLLVELRIRWIPFFKKPGSTPVIYVVRPQTSEALTLIYRLYITIYRLVGVDVLTRKVARVHEKLPTAARVE